MTVVASKDRTTILDITVDEDGDRRRHNPMSILPVVDNNIVPQILAAAGDSYITPMPFDISVGSIVEITIRIGDAYVDETRITALDDLAYIEGLYRMPIEQSTVYIRVKIFLEGPLE